MKMMLSLEIKDDLLIAFIGGPFSLNEAKRTFSEILEAVLTHRISNILIDGSAVTGDIKKIDRFYYSVFVADSVKRSVFRDFDQIPRFAYVLKTPILDNNRYGEKIARSRGMTVKVFPEKEDALNWLDSKC